MDIDDDDDLYGPEEGDVTAESKATAPTGNEGQQQTSQTSHDDDLEEGEEEDEGEDMDEDDSVCGCLALSPVEGSSLPF